MARDKAVSLPEACARVRVDYWTAWREIAAGRIPAERRGRGWYVRPDVLRRALKPPPAARAPAA